MIGIALARGISFLEIFQRVNLYFRVPNSFFSNEKGRRFRFG